MFEGGQYLVGHHQRAVRTDAAQQGLETDDAAILQVDLGLIPGHGLGMGERIACPLQHPRLGLPAFQQAGLEQAGTSAPAIFRLIQGDVGMLH